MTAGWNAPGFVTAFTRAMSRRCPRCGGKGIFTGWFAMEPECPGCGLRFEREEGYWTGAVALNLIVTEGLFIVLLVLGIVLTWPDVPWGVILAVSIGVNIVVPIVFQPFSRTLWVALERGVRRWVEPQEG